LAATTDAPLLQIDVDTGDVTEVGPTGLSGVVDLAYESEGDRLLVAADQLYAVDPTSGAATTVGALPDATRGIAFTADGRLWALTAPDLAADAALVEACRASVAALGFEGYEEAPGAAIAPGELDMEMEVASSETATPEIVAYASLGESPAGERVVQVATSNDEAAICLTLAEGQTRVVVPSSVELAALVIHGLDATVTVELDDEFEPDSLPAVHAGGVDAVWVIPEDERVHLYSTAEWEDRLIVLDPSPTVPGPGVLHELDPADGSSLGSVTLEDAPTPTSPLTAWQP
jgi:hypothetical protein